MSKSKPAKTRWIDLSERGGRMGREDCQAGWHRFVNELAGRPWPFGAPSILDVGAGLAKSKERIRNVVTQDPAPIATVDLHTPVEQLNSNSYDFVTAFDVIEHVVEDVDFLHNLCRIARHRVFISTPNLNVSGAANGCHCREYDPQEFLDLVRRYHPSAHAFDLYVGSGDGSTIIACSAEAFPLHKSPHQAALIKTDLGNLHRWEPWHRHIQSEQGPVAYGTTPAYAKGAAWLEPCETIEDWGCGLGGFRPYVPPQKYRGVDGTPSAFTDVVVNLINYRPDPPPEGIFMRGVIEHEPNWRLLLENALGQFTKRMALVLFTPVRTDSYPTYPLTFNLELGVPDLSFNLRELTLYLSGIKWKMETFESETGYGRETIFYLSKEQP